jgi:teichoic acid transport system permease protein
VSTQAASPSGERAYSHVVQVFEPNALTFPPLRSYLAELVDRRAFITELATAEVRGQRSTTFLGELWSLIDPLFQATIYWFLFSVIRGGNNSSSAFVTAIISSVFLFNYTRISINDGGRAILRNKGLVLNAIFPRGLLPIAEVYKGWRSTVPAFVVYVPIHLALGGPITSAFLLLPLLVVLLTGINLGLALLFATATAYSKDVSQLLNYILRILMFATPVVYPVALLSPTIRAVLAWNPLFALFTAFQQIITGQVPSFGLFVQSTLWAIVLMVAGIWVFLRHERSFGLYL